MSDEGCPRGYAADQSHIEPMEHAHEQEAAFRSKAVNAAVIRFALAIGDLCAAGVDGLSIVLPDEAYQLVKSGVREERRFGDVLGLYTPMGFVKIRSAKE